jgi:cell division protein FtsN
MPIRTADVVDRPGTDLPHAIARDVASATLVARRETPAVPVVPAPSAAAVVPSPVPAVMLAVPHPAEPLPVPALEPARDPSLGTTAGPGSVAAAVMAMPSVPRETPAVPVPPPPAAVTATAAAPALAAVTPVRAIEPPRPAPPAARPSPATGIWVQVGAYKSASTAGRVAAQVKGEILVVADAAAGGGRAEPLLRVRVGPFADHAQATARLREIRSLGYQPFLATRD